MIHRLLTKAANAILNGREQSSCSLRRNTSPHTTEYAICRCGLYCGDALNINANKQTRTLGIVKRGTDCRESEEQVTFVPSPNILKSHLKKKKCKRIRIYMQNNSMNKWWGWLSECAQTISWSVSFFEQSEPLRCVLLQQDKQLGPARCLLLTYLWGGVVGLV